MKSLSFRIFVIMLVITANVAACKHVAYEYSKGENNCPYEGLECPNAEAAVATYMDSLLIYQGEVDELRDRNIFLQGQIDLYHAKFGPINGHQGIVKGNEQ